jgi:dihydroorotase
MIKAGLNPEEIVEKLSIKPREILELDIPKVEEKETANFVLFNEAEWDYNEENNYSKSANTPFLNQQLKGKVWLTCNNNQVFVSN